MEVVVITGDQAAKGEPYVQCRVLTSVGEGGLHLYPVGGAIHHMKDVTGREQIQKKSNVRDCYMKGVKVNAKMSKSHRLQTEEFLMYSAMCHTPVAKKDSDPVAYNSIAPFWAVMIGGRDQEHMVNTKCHMEEYTLPFAQPKQYYTPAAGTTTKVYLPFLVNTVDLRAGDILVLNHNAGGEDFIKDDFPTIE